MKVANVEKRFMAVSHRQFPSFSTPSLTQQTASGGKKKKEEEKKINTIATEYISVVHSVLPIPCYKHSDTPTQPR